MTQVGVRVAADVDKDGFSDEIETALGTSASDANETPMGVSPARVAQELTASKLKVRLNFAKAGAHAITLQTAFAHFQGSLVWEC